MSTGQGLLGNNMFAYCENNPINYSDPFGYCACSPGGIERDALYSYMCPCCGSGAGGFVILFPPTLITDILDSASESLDDLLKELEDALAATVAQSLAKSKTNHSNNGIHRHHIVPQNDPRGLPAYIVLQEVFPGQGIHDSRNLVQVSSRIHARLHTKVYYAFVNVAITTAYLFAGDSADAKVANVTAALDRIREVIMLLEFL